MCIFKKYFNLNSIKKYILKNFQKNRNSRQSWREIKKQKKKPKFPQMLQNDIAIDLVGEMKGDKLKKYNISTTNKLRAENEKIEAQMEKFQIEAAGGLTDEISINYAILHLHKERNLRILRGYHFSRLLKIENSYFTKTDIRNKLSISEAEFLNDYTAILDEFLNNFGNLDFHNRHIPIDFFVQFVPLEDCGIVLSGDEFIDLKKNRLYFLKKSDIVHLIDNKTIKIL